MVAMDVWPTDGAAGSVATEARWRQMGRHWLPTGVVYGVGGNLAPSFATPNLTVQSGACWVDGHYCVLAGTQVLTASANGIAVVRFDPAANTAELVWRDGVSVPAQSPTGTWEFLIAKTAAGVLTDLRAFSTPGGSAGLTAARPATPGYPMRWWATDTRRDWQYDAAAGWLLVGGNMPRVRLTASGAASVPAATPFTPGWAIEAYDTDNLHDIATAGRINVGAFAGRWRFDYLLEFASGQQGGRQIFIEVVPGAARYAVQATYHATSGAWPTQLVGSAEIDMPAGSYAHLGVFQNSAAAVLIQSNTFENFSGVYVGPA